METEAQSSLASFLADVNPAISTLMKGTGGPSDEGLAGIIRHGIAKIDPNEAAFSLLSNSKAFPQGPPEELRKVLHHMAKKHRSKMHRAKKSIGQQEEVSSPTVKITPNDLTGMALKRGPVTSENIAAAAEEEPTLTTTDEDIKKAVKTCNDMAEKAQAQLDILTVRCWADGNATRKQQEQVIADIARLEEEETKLETKNLRTKTSKQEGEEELATVKATNTSETIKYQEEYKSMKDEMSKLMSELAQTKFMLNITVCPDLPSGFIQTNPKKSSVAGGKKIEFCQTSGNDGTTKFAFIDPRLESGNKRLSLQSQERLAEALSGLAYGPTGEKLDDGDDENADESGPMEDVDQDEGIALIQKSGTGRRTGEKGPVQTMDCVAPCGVNCKKLKSECFYLYDKFAEIWGEVKDQVEKLQMEMDQRTVEYEKLKSFNNREAEILSHQISSLDEEFLDGESQKISIGSKLPIKRGENGELEKSYKKLEDDCCEEFEYIAGTLLCGPLAVKNELIKNLNNPEQVGLESPPDPTEVGDCEMGCWIPEKCSVECDDTLVGGFQTMVRRVIEPTNGELGLKCPAQTMEMKCGQRKCPVNCEVDDWGDWSECTRECGGGGQTRTRAVSVHPANGGEGCEPLTDVQSCNSHSCDEDCGLLDWTDWSPCSAACGGGAQAKFKNENPQKPAKGLNGQCPDYYDAKRYKNQTCNEQPCIGDEVCTANMDVVILLDSSGSVREKGFNILKNFSLKILERVKSTSYGNKAVRVGVVQFGNGHLKVGWQDKPDTVTPAKLIQSFSSNFAGVKTKISQMVFQKGFTNMAQAFIKAKDLLSKKGDEGAAGTVLMITDGFPSFEVETEQAAQRLRASANLVIAHVKRSPKPYDVQLMQKYARYSGNYLHIPGKQKLKEDMQTYAGQAVVRMCPVAESISEKFSKDQRRGFQKKLQGFWCYNPMPVQWFSGHEGYGGADFMSKEKCAAKAESVSSEWKIFEYTWYPGSTFHECLVYTTECNNWARWTHANIYEKFVPPAETLDTDSLSSIGPDAEFNPAR
jgi:Mg-chelatase subunit ChlD